MKMKSLLNKNFKVLLFLLSLFMLVSISRKKKVARRSTTKIKNLPYIEGKIGINSYTKSFATSECYNPPTIHIGASETELKLSSSMKRKELFDSLKMSGAINVGVSGVSVGASYNLEKTFVENSNTSSHYYYVKFTRNRFFSYSPTLNSILNAQGLKTYNITVQKKVEDFYIYCGDSVVTSVKEGGFIVIQVNINFKDEQNKNSFEGKISAGVGDIAKIGADLLTNKELKKYGGTINFKGIQIGGNAGRFYELFPKNTSEKCAISVTAKSQEKKKAQEECTSFLDNVSVYIRTDFSNQFNVKDDDQNIYKTFNYKRRVEDVFNLPKFDEKNKASNNLINKLKEFMQSNGYYYSKLKKFSESYFMKPYLNVKFTTKMKGYLKTLYENYLNLYINSFGDFKLKNCFEDSTKCTETNFNKGFGKLKNIFNEIDTLMLEMKFVIDYYLPLNDCGYSFLNNAYINISVYPLGENRFGLLYINSNLFNLCPDFDGYYMTNSITRNFNDFEFQIAEKYPHSRAKVTPIGGYLNPLKVSIVCSTQTTESLGIRRLNENYFESFQMVDY